MGIELFSLWIDGTCVAQEMSIETAAVLMKALFNEYYAESNLEITIKRQNCDFGMDEERGLEEFSSECFTK